MDARYTHGRISCLRRYTGLYSARDGHGSARDLSDPANDLGVARVVLEGNVVDGGVEVEILLTR